MRILIALSSICVVLVGCQTANENKIWLRTDGRSQVGNPQLASKFEVDRTVCVGEAQKASLGAPVVYSDGSPAGTVGAAMVVGGHTAALDDVFKGCMAQRGYVLVPKDQAAARAASFRANAGKT